MRPYYSETLHGKDHGLTVLLTQIFAYQAWANNDLFDKLADADGESGGAEMHAALRLVNHSYVVARIFAAHLTGTDHGYASDNTEETPSLEALRAAVTLSDQWYLDYLQGADHDDLAEPVAFTFTDGDKGQMTREEMLVHVALHGSYHRGEVGRMLWQRAVTPPWDTFAVFLHQREPARRQQAGRRSAA
jgi:uncharacterized damage-inducible protein DinB